MLVLLLVGILLQTTFGNDLRVHDIAPDFMLLLAVSAGFAGGADAGAVIGFSAGLVSDLFLQSTPFGLSALAFCLAGFSIGWARANLLRSQVLLAPFLVATGTVVGVVLFVVVGYVVGQQQLVAPGQSWLVQLAFIEAPYSAVFALPTVVLMSWALRGPSATSATLTPVTTAGTLELSGRRHPVTPRNRRRRRVRARVR